MVDDADAAKGQGPQHALSWRVYETILKYFNKRLDTQGVEDTDAQVEKLGRLLFAERKVTLRADHYRVTKHSARLLSARRAYAAYNGVEMAKVTQRVSQESQEGLEY